MVTSPIALPCCLPSELIAYIIKKQAYPTTLIICASKGDFVSSLQHDIIRFQTDRHKDLSSDDIPSEVEAGASQLPITTHSLLHPTLHQLSITRYLQTVFVPSISHLRAYLSVFTNISTTSSKEPPPILPPECEKRSQKAPLLVVYGLIELHQHTSDWSAQGLGTSLADAVEAGRRAGRELILVEPLPHLTSMDEGASDQDNLEQAHLPVVVDRDGAESEKVNDQMNDSRADKSEAVWKERVPILNRSGKRQFVNDSKPEGDTWMGRTVEVGAVLGRWFTFANGGFWTDQESAL